MAEITQPPRYRQVGMRALWRKSIYYGEYYSTNEILMAQMHFLWRKSAVEDPGRLIFFVRPSKQDSFLPADRSEYRAVAGLR
jgi:hypothetical protein